MIRARVWDRSHSRSGRHDGARGGAANSRGAAAPRPGRRRDQADRTGRARSHPARDHRRPGRRSAARLRGRAGHGDRQRRDLQPPRAEGRARAARPPVRHPLRQRGRGARLRGARARLRATAQRDLRVRPVGRGAPAARGRSRSVRRQAPLLVQPRRAGGARLRDRRAARRGLRATAGRPRRARPLPGLPLRALAADAVRGDRQIATRRDARGAGGRDATRRELARAAGCPLRGDRRRRTRHAARRALRGRRRAADDVGPAARPSRPPPSQSASLATMRCSTSASMRPTARA